MGKPSPCFVALALAGLLGMSGCAGGVLNGGRKPASQHARHAGGPRAPNAADPDYNEVYSRYREEMASRPLTAPALGIGGRKSSPPIRLVGLGDGASSVAKSVSSSVQTGFSKVGKMVAPEERRSRDAEPTSVFSNAKPSAELYVAMARLSEQSGNLSEAEQRYRQALELTPNHLGALLGYAHLKDRVGRLDDAVQLYEQAAAAYPDQPSVFNDMGLCLARNGRLQEAMTKLNVAIRLQPKKPLYRNNIAIVLTEMGQTETAFLHLRIVQPEAVARYNLGHLLLRKGQRSAAAGQFALALRSDPTLAQAGVWLQELQRLGVTPPQPAERTAARPYATPNVRRIQQTRPGIRPPAPRANQRAVPAIPPPPPRPAAEKRPTNDQRSVYGNRPVPMGRRMWIHPTAPKAAPSPPATRTRVGTPPATIQQRPRPHLLAPPPPPGALAPLPPVPQSAPRIEPLPAVETAPLPDR